MTVDVELKKKEAQPQISIDALSKDKKKSAPHVARQANSHSAPKDRGLLFEVIEFLFCDCTMFVLKFIWHTISFLGKGLFYVARGVGHILHALMDIFD